MVFRRHFIALLLMAALVIAQGSSPSSGETGAGSSIYFPGRLLIAAPKIRDPRFRKSVIYLVKHTAGGAYGIIVNKVLAERQIASLMERFGMDPRGASGKLELHFGGPVNHTGAFILHSSEYKGGKIREINGAISFTTDISILRAIAQGHGPRRVLLALGYAGWGAGQLGDEIARGDWSLTAATQELVFGEGEGDIWDRIIDSSRVPL